MSFECIGCGAPPNLLHHSWCPERYPAIAKGLAWLDAHEACAHVAGVPAIPFNLFRTEILPIPPAIRRIVSDKVFGREDLEGAVDKLRTMPLPTMADHVELPPLASVDQKREHLGLPPLAKTLPPVRPSLSVVDGSAAWDPDVVADLRARFEKAIRECDRIVVFSARRQGMQLIVDANSDTRSPPRIPWFEMLGFMQAKLANWAREMLGES